MNIFSEYNLIDAIMKGDVAMVEKLTMSCNNDSVIRTLSDTNCYITTIIKRKQIKIAKLLLRSGSNIIKQDEIFADSPLHAAVEIESLEIISEILERGGNVNIKNYKNETALHLAVIKENLNIAEFLLNNRANLNVLNSSGLAPLHHAIKLENVKMIELLLQYRPCLDVKSQFGMSLLLTAVNEQNVKIVEDLLNSGASIDLPSCWDNCYQLKGYTPLHHAARRGNEEIVKLLLGKGANVNAKAGYLTALHYAAENKNYGIVKVLLEHKDIDVRDRKCFFTLLDIVIRDVDIESFGLKEILKIHPEIKNEDKRWYLRHFFQKKDNELLWSHVGPDTRELVSLTIKILLSHGFTVYPEDASDRSFLHDVVEKGSIEIIRMLLLYGADVDSPHVNNKNYTLLHHAADKGHLSVAKLLIEYGANVNIIDIDGNRPLSYAIMKNDIEITKLLVSSGAKIEYPWLTCIGNMSLDNFEITKILVDHESLIDINEGDVFNRNVLHFISVHDDIISSQDDNLTRYLFEKLSSQGADVNWRDSSGWSVLHRAIENHQNDFVEILLKYNADVNISANILVYDNKTGYERISRTYTPLQLASERGNERITRMLITAGARLDDKDISGRTALLLACRNEHEKVVAALLEFGAKIDDISNGEISPLHIAVINGSLVIVETLLKACVDVQYRNKDGPTALYLAMKHGHEKIFEELLAYYGANIKPHLLRGKKYKSFMRDIKDLRKANMSPILEVNTDYLIKRHFIKSKSLNMYLNRRYRKTFNFGSGYFTIVCDREVELMNCEKICGTDISYYDILTKSINQLAILTQNKSIADVLESSSRDKRFPTYGKILYYHFKKGQKRRNLLNSSLKSFKLLSGFALPQIISLKMLNYLCNEDLNNLIKAGPDNDRG